MAQKTPDPRGLSEHGRIGSRLTPPFVDKVGASGEVKRPDGPLPELLWLGLLNDRYTRIGVRAPARVIRAADRLAPEVAPAEGAREDSQGVAAVTSADAVASTRRVGGA